MNNNFNEENNSQNNGMTEEYSYFFQNDKENNKKNKKNTVARDRKQKLDTKKIVGMAVFAALAFAVTLVIHIPVSFLTFDAKDAVLTVAAFIYGPASAVIMSLAVSLIELVTISDTAFYGALMNFASSAAFAGVASLIYKYKRTFNGAIIGIYSAVALTTAIMMPMNIIITPLYMGVPRSAVIDLIPTLLLPFNFAKSLMNGAIVMLIYKPVASAMRRAHLLDGAPMGLKFNKQSVITIVIGALSLAAAIALFIILNK